MEWATTTKWPAYGHIAIAAGEVDTYVWYGPATHIRGITVCSASFTAHFGYDALICLVRPDVITVNVRIFGAMSRPQRSQWIAAKWAMLPQRRRQQRCSIDNFVRHGRLIHKKATSSSDIQSGIPPLFGSHMQASAEGNNAALAQPYWNWHHFKCQWYQIQNVVRLSIPLRRFVLRRQLFEYAYH